MDKEKMINLMVDRYEQFALPERTQLALINLGNRYSEVEKMWRQKKDSETIPFTWEKDDYDLSDPDDRAEIRHAERNLLSNLSKEERFNVFCLMEIGRWVDYNKRFDMDAVNDFIAWVDEWYAGRAGGVPRVRSSAVYGVRREGGCQRDEEGHATYLFDEGRIGIQD